ncbi:MAG: hypothetical protein U0031_18050 [Thermomicrobiales bacterium]
MFAAVARVSRSAVVAGLALTMLASGGASLLGGDHVEAAKKVTAPNIAIQSITLAPNPDPGHKTVVVLVANVGTRNAAGFSIGMVAERADHTKRVEEFSQPLSIAKGTSVEVEFRLGCNWINGGTVTARTNPSPVPGELPTKTANNIETQSFGNECA